MKKVFISAILGVMSLMFVSGTAFSGLMPAKDFVFPNHWAFVFDDEKTNFLSVKTSSSSFNSIAEQKKYGAHLFIVKGTSDAQIKKVISHLANERRFNSYRIIGVLFPSDLNRIAKDIVTVGIMEGQCPVGWLLQYSRVIKSCKKMSPNLDNHVIYDFLVSDAPNW